jgi:hypothetical protein
MTDSIYKIQNMFEWWCCELNMNTLPTMSKLSLTVINNETEANLYFYVLYIIISPFSFGHCIVCPSIYGFWLITFSDLSKHTTCFKHFYIFFNCICGVMVSMLMVDRGFEPQLGQTKEYKICICCFSAKHAALRRKSKDWLARNQNNVSEWSDMSTLGLLFQWASTINVQLSMLV